MAKVFDFMNSSIQKELTYPNSMPLTATYSNQNNILDSHNSTNNNNSHYVQKQITVKNVKDSNLINSNFSNNENEVKNDICINSDVQCWLDFVFDCSSKKANDSKIIKPNPNQNNNNESSQLTNSAYYNSSNSISRDNSYLQPSSNTLNNKNNYYEKLENNNAKMKSATSIQNLCDTKDEEFNYMNKRIVNHDYSQHSNFNKISSYNSVQDNKANCKNYPQQNMYSYSNNEKEFPFYNYNQNPRSQYQDINSQNNFSSYYPSNYHARSRSHSQPQIYSQQSVPLVKNKSQSQTQSPVYQSIDQSQNNSYSLNDQVEKKLNIQSSKQFLSSSSSSISTINFNNVNKNKNINDIININGNNNSMDNNNRPMNHYAPVSSYNQSDSTMSSSSTVINDRSNFENKYYEKSTESETYYNSSHSSPNHLSNHNNNDFNATNKSFDIENKYLLSSTQLKTCSYKSPPQNLSTYHLQSQSHNSMMMDYNNNNNSSEDITTTQYSNEKKSYHESNSSNIYYSSNSNLNNYLYSKSKPYCNKNSTINIRNSIDSSLNYEMKDTDNNYKSSFENSDIKFQLNSLLDEPIENITSVNYNNKNSTTIPYSSKTNVLTNESSDYSNKNVSNYQQLNNNNNHDHNGNADNTNNNDNSDGNNNSNNEEEEDNNNNNADIAISNNNYNITTNHDNKVEEDVILNGAVRNSLPVYPDKLNKGYERSKASSTIKYDEQYPSSFYGNRNLGMEEQKVSTGIVDQILNNYQSSLSTLNFPIKQKTTLEEKHVLSGYRQEEKETITIKENKRKSKTARKSSKRIEKRQINKDKSQIKIINDKSNDNENSSIDNKDMLTNKSNNELILGDGSNGEHMKLVKNEILDSVSNSDLASDLTSESFILEQNNDNKMDEEIEQIEDTLSLTSTKTNRRSSKSKSRTKSGKSSDNQINKTTVKSNSNEDSKSKSKHISKISSSTTIKINSSHINKAKEENSVTTKVMRKNGIVGSHNKDFKIKNSHKKPDSTKARKETEEKKISIIIKKSLIDAATNNKQNTATNNAISKKSKILKNDFNQLEKGESIDNEDKILSKNILPIKIPKSKLKITMGKDKKDSNNIESNKSLTTSKKYQHTLNKEEMEDKKENAMQIKDITYSKSMEEVIESTDGNDRIETSNQKTNLVINNKESSGRGRKTKNKTGNKKNNKIKKGVNYSITNADTNTTINTITTANDSRDNDNGQKLERKDKEKIKVIKDIEQSDDKLMETIPSYEFINNTNLLPKELNKKMNSSLQTPPETPSSSVTMPLSLPLQSNTISTSSNMVDNLDSSSKDNIVLHELGMDDNDDFNSDLSSLSELDYCSSDDNEASASSDASSLFSDNSSLSSISSMSFSSSISTKSKMKGINLQEAKVDLILPNNDITNEFLDITGPVNHGNNTLFSELPKKASVVSFTDEVDENTKKKRKNINDQQLKPAIKMNYKKVKTDKDESKDKNSNIIEDAYINKEEEMKQRKEFEKSKIKQKGDSAIVQSMVIVKDAFPTPEDSLSSSISKEHATSINSSIDLNEIQLSKKRKMSISESSDANSTDSKTDDQKDSLYHTYLAIGEIVKTDPLFMDLTLEERIKLRRRQRNSKETILSFKDFDLEDLEKYKSMRKNNDPLLSSKRKSKDRKESIEESYPLHSIETIVTKNKASENATSDRYNLQTLIKNGADIEAHSVYKKTKSFKKKIIDNDDKSEIKIEVKPEIKEEPDISKKEIKYEINDSSKISLKSENMALETKYKSSIEEDKSVFKTTMETKTELENDEIKKEIKKDIKIEEPKKIKVEEKPNVSTDKEQNVSFQTNVKSNDTQVSESSPSTPIIKKRKRGRPSRASKSNTISPLSFSPSSSTNSVTSSPESSKIDYSLFGMLRSSRRAHHGTFEKKCVQCNAVISPTEYAKNGVICGHCWKLNFKD
ncbi:hypothetical protein BCR36DRAFT_581129 [Piromyces finnis]|uniref:Uncharacterized protein n=1 Tax=Piromyces finnis TaxID=1754191 RepID=A0A1Y1VGX2_9FUNG|nr:hypothetical protein BCR36DRAFT_581129 [Piromyces finnis]|eukprot:ORX55968.1 hypothetical protein BCR36DRAFT_581129 [Piromyces finnis]